MSSTRKLTKAKRILKNEGYSLRFNGQMWELTHKTVTGTSLVNFDKLIQMSEIFTNKFK